MPRSVKDAECYLPIQMDNPMAKAEKGERAMWKASREDCAHEKNLSTHNCGTMFSEKRYSFQLFVDMSATGEETWGHNEPKTRVLWAWKRTHLGHARRGERIRPRGERIRPRGERPAREGSLLNPGNAQFKLLKNVHSHVGVMIHSWA